MGDMGDYWRDVKPYLKEKNAKDREDNYDNRIKYAIETFNKNNVQFKLCNISNGHFNLLYGGKTILSFWAWTGKCYNHLTKSSDNIGITNCIKKYKRIIGGNK